MFGIIIRISVISQGLRKKKKERKETPDDSHFREPSRIFIQLNEDYTKSVLDLRHIVLLQTHSFNALLEFMQRFIIIY